MRVRVRFGNAVGLPFPAPHSLATGDSQPRLAVAHVRQAGDTVIVESEGLVVRAMPSPVRLTVRDVSGRELVSETLGALAWQGRLAHVVARDSTARYFGVGEQPFGLERSGNTYPFWNTDRGIQLGQMPVYSSFPTPLPPRWALGYHQSRYSYHPDTQVVNLAAEFRRRRIPADVIHFDIHFMDGYRVFTWNPVEFSHPKRLIDSLGSHGFKVVTIVDPGVKIDSGYSVYRSGLARHAFVLVPNGSPLIGEVWPGRSVFPDFSRRATRTWWGDLHRALVDSGVAGISNDMNEPASFGAQRVSVCRGCRSLGMT